jgi:hypothetical protein
MPKKKPRQLKSTDVPKLRNFLLKKHHGLCQICDKVIGEGEAVLDHHHKKKVGGTGLVRGVLCRTCNVFLAKSENNCKRYKIQPHDLPRVLRNMADFLERKQLPYIHPSEAPKKQILKKSSYNKLRKAYKGRAKFPTYRTNKKDKPVQGLTKQLDKLFKEYGISPEFYK